MLPVLKQLLRQAYRRVPLKQQIFEIARRFGTPPETLYKHLHFHGVFETRMGDRVFKMRHQGFEIENSIFWAGIDGGWERVSLGLWCQLCAKANVIFDIGANTGIYALIAKAMNPEARVYAFEPLKRVCERLRNNVELNHYDITCEECAVSDQDGTAVIYDPGGENVLSVTVNKDLSPRGTKTIPTTINTVRMETYLRKHGLPPIDLMKIDVETHEFEVLRGLGPYLSAMRPTMLIEILRDDVGAAVENLVKDLGYIYYNIDELNSVPRRVDKILASDYYNYLLCSEKQGRALGLL